MKCQHCNKREATINWVGGGSFLEYNHGFYERWCERCATKEQLKHAKKEMKRLPKLIIKLEKKLERLL
jgi:protein-arginine kinase activator protein McsA